MFSTDDFRPMHSLTFELCFVFRIGPQTRLCLSIEFHLHVRVVENRPTTRTCFATLS